MLVVSGDMLIMYACTGRVFEQVGGWVRGSLRFEVKQT